MLPSSRQTYDRLISPPSTPASQAPDRTRRIEAAPMRGRRHTAFIFRDRWWYPFANLVKDAIRAALPSTSGSRFSVLSKKGAPHGRKDLAPPAEQTPYDRADGDQRGAERLRRRIGSPTDGCAGDRKSTR